MEHVKNLPNDFQKILWVYCKTHSIYSYKTGVYYPNVDDRYLIHSRVKKLTGESSGERYNTITEDINYYMSMKIKGYTEYFSATADVFTITSTAVEHWLDSVLITIR